jgi:hypothetical protein
LKLRPVEAEIVIKALARIGIQPAEANAAFIKAKELGHKG